MHELGSANVAFAVSPTTALVHVDEKVRTSGNVPFEKTINKQVCENGEDGQSNELDTEMEGNGHTFPQAPSPTMTSFLRISDMMCRS